MSGQVSSGLLEWQKGRWFNRDALPVAGAEQAIARTARPRIMHGRFFIIAYSLPDATFFIANY